MHSLGVIVGCDQTKDELFQELCNWQDCAFDGVCDISKENENEDWLPDYIPGFAYGNAMNVDKVIKFIKTDVFQIIYGYHKFEQVYPITRFKVGEEIFADRKSLDFENFLINKIKTDLKQHPMNTCLLFYDYHS